MSNAPSTKQTKLERERAMYERCGVLHPKDKATEVALKNLKNMMRKTSTISPSPSPSSDPADHPSGS